LNPHTFFEKKRDISNMKVLKKSLVAAGLATAVFATGAAQAATISNASTGTAYSNTIVNESTQTTVDVPKLQVKLSTGQDLSIDDSITITLSGGVFKQVANDNMSVSGGGSFAVAIADGGIGKNFVKYRVTGKPGDAALMSFGQDANGNSIGAKVATMNLSTVAASTNVQATFEMKGFVGGESTPLFGSPLTSNLIKKEALATVKYWDGTNTSAQTQTFSVANGFKSIKGETPNSKGETTSGTGGVDVDYSKNAAAGQNTSGVPSAIPDPKKTLIKMTGDMTGVKSISATNVNGSTCTGGALTTAITGGLSVDKTGGTACGLAQSDSTHGMKITFDGSKAYEPGSYTVEVTTLQDGTNYAPSTVGSVVTHKFNRDGSSFITNSFGKLNKLSISDRSGALGGTGADGKVTITAWDSAGMAVTCTGLDLTVPSNGTLVIQGETITTACPGAKRIEGVVNSNSVLVTNTKQTTSGATMQSATSSGGNAAVN
jgi:hypothetical protein